MATLEEIGARLEDQSIGVVNTDIFLAQEPDQPDALLSVLATAGLQSLEAMGVPDLVLQPSFQVMARARKTNDARDKANAARKALHGFSGTLSADSESARYLRITALQSEAFPIAQDDSKRWKWVCNFQVHKDPSVPV